MQAWALTLLDIVKTSTQYSLYNYVCASVCVWNKNDKINSHTHKSHSSSTPIFLTPPLLKHFQTKLDGQIR